MPRVIPLDPGVRDRKVTIEQATTATGTGGFPVETWTTLVSMYASRAELAARERMTGADRHEARYTTRWEINYRADMDPESVDVAAVRRVVHEGRVHDIVSASVIGRRMGIELMTKAASA